MNTPGYDDGQQRAVGSHLRAARSEIRAAGSHLAAAVSHLLALGCAPLGALLSRSWAAAWALYAIVFLVGTVPSWTGTGYPMWDASNLFAPNHMLLGDFLSAGRLFLWNPWINAGSPEFTDPQVGLFSPVSCLFAWIGHGTLAGYQAQWLFSWFLPGAGMLFLGRHLGVKPWAALVIACGFTFSGYFTGHAEHLPELSTLAWVPLILWRLEVALSRGKWWPAVEAGALWGLSGVCGYPSLALGSAAFLALWVAGRALFPEGGARTGLPARGARAAAQLAVLGLTGVLVLGPNYFLFFHEALGFADRASALSRDYSMSNSLPAGALATLGSPFLHMQQMLGWKELWKDADVSSICLYLGAATLVLALFALGRARREPFRFWLLGVALVTFAFTFGRDLPVRGWAYDYLPITRYFRHPAFFRGFPMQALAVLALLGARDLARDEDGTSTSRWRPLAVLATSVGTLALVGFFSLARVGGRVLRLGAAHALLIWIALAVLLWMLALRPRARAWAPLALVLLAAVDALMTVKITNLHIWESGPETAAIWSRLAELHERSMNVANHPVRGYRYPSDVEVPWRLDWSGDLRSAVIKRPILDGYTALANALYIDFVANPTDQQLLAGPDRFYFSPEAPRVAPTHLAYWAFKARVRDPRSPPLVLHTPEDMVHVARYASLPDLDGPSVEAVNDAPAATPVPARIVRYRPEELDLEVDAPSPGWLLVTDRWTRSWKATVNGRPTELLGADFFFRAVHVDQGLNQVRMVYRPLGMPWLLLPGWATVAVVLAGSLALALRRRRRDRGYAAGEVPPVLQADRG